MNAALIPAPVFPGGDVCLADVFLYALGTTDNARRKLTDADVRDQPVEGPVWDRYPLKRLANWYIFENCQIGKDHPNNAFVRSLRKDQKKGLTPAQVRGACNVLLGAWKRGERYEWMVS